MSWGRRLQAFGADMRKVLSPNFSLDRGVNSSYHLWPIDRATTIRRPTLRPGLRVTSLWP